jgi:excinuclease ABC subunit A
MRKKGFIRARIDGKIYDLTKEEERDIFFSRELACPQCGISYPEISPRFFSFNSPYGACPRCNGIGFENISEEGESLGELKPCSLCKGLRLRKEALGVKVRGFNIGELSGLSVRQAKGFFEHLELNEREHTIAAKVLQEIRERLIFLEKVGVGYLTLDRSAFTLSGGEGQRIRLATQVGSSDSQHRSVLPLRGHCISLMNPVSGFIQGIVGNCLTVCAGSGIWGIL